MKHIKSTHTIGIDLGDKAHETCTLNAEGEIIERSTVLNNRENLIAFSRANRGAMLIMEAGCHCSSLARLSGHPISSPGIECRALFGNKTIYVLTHFVTVDQPAVHRKRPQGHRGQPAQVASDLRSGQ